MTGCPNCGASHIEKRDETLFQAIERGLSETAARRVAKSNGAESYVESLNAIMQEDQNLNAFDIAGMPESRTMPVLEARRALEKRFAGDTDALAKLRDAFIVASR